MQQLNTKFLKNPKEWRPISAMIYAVVISQTRLRIVKKFYLIKINKKVTLNQYLSSDSNATNQTLY